MCISCANSWGIWIHVWVYIHMRIYIYILCRYHDMRAQSERTRVWLRNYVYSEWSCCYMWCEWTWQSLMLILCNGDNYEERIPPDVRYSSEFLAGLFLRKRFFVYVSSTASWPSHTWLVCVCLCVIFVQWLIFFVLCRTWAVSEFVCKRRDSVRSLELEFIMTGWFNLKSLDY